MIGSGVPVPLVSIEREDTSGHERGHVVSVLSLGGERDREAGAPVEPPFAAVERAWQDALERARRSFAPGGEPLPETLLGAAVLELRLGEEPWPLVSPTRAEARALLAEVYAGRLRARIGPDGRIRLGSAREGLA